MKLYRLSITLGDKSYVCNNINGDDIIKTEELHIELPQAIINELNWEDGTVVEWEVQSDGLISLRNIEGIEL